MDRTVNPTSVEVSLLNTRQDKTNCRYNKSYNAFIKWQESNGIDSFDEDILLAYFNNAAKILKPSSLWSMYSMLKSTLSIYNTIDISTNSRLLAFLKETAVGFESKKSKVFSAEEINKFIAEAPDEHYLAIKTILVFGVAGECRGEEITTLKTEYVTDSGDDVIVDIPTTKRSGPKLFVIRGEFAKIVQQYMQLRPANLMTDRFFLQYQQGECLRQVMGKNKVSIAPKEIAKFLKLDAYKSYTGQSFQPTLSSNGTKARKRRRWEPFKIAKSEPQNDTSEELDSSTKMNSNVDNDMFHRQRSVPDTSYNVYYEITNLSEDETEMCSEPIMPMLPLTTALMKRKSKFYMGLPRNHFLRLHQLASQRQGLSDIKLLLTLRKIRLDEDFEVIGDLFDLDKTTAEQYYHEVKNTVIELMDLSATTIPISKEFAVISEPIIKIEECDTPYIPDPIAVPMGMMNTYDSAPELKVDDDDDDGDDDFEFNIPEADPGFLSDDIRKRTAECPVCHKFYVPRILNSHMESVHFNLVNLNRTICGLCWQKFETVALLKIHQKDAHGGCSYGCDVCSRMFSSKRYLTTHILTKHTQLKSHLCETCGEGFPIQNLLNYHIRQKHVQSGHHCYLCDKKFDTVAALKIHVSARHTDERPLKCEVNGCGKTFSWPSAFQSHKRVHANDKYECSICSKRFSFKGNLQNHLRTIHNEIVNNACLSSNFV